MGDDLAIEFQPRCMYAKVILHRSSGKSRIFQMRGHKPNMGTKKLQRNFGPNWGGGVSWCSI